MRTEKVSWIDAAYCYKKGGDSYFFSSPDCLDGDVKIELDKSNGRLFIHRAPYRDEKTTNTENKWIIAEYFCKNADPIK